jgi:predicted translin family RNA/ssDNA-binding protein
MVEYEEVPEEVSFEGFSFSEYYKDEKEKLKPQLEKLGYMNISFVMGECDSFGPLSRIIYATDPNGNFHRFVYG